MKLNSFWKTGWFRASLVIFIFAWIFTHIDGRQLIRVAGTIRWGWYALALTLMLPQFLLIAVGTRQITRSVNLPTSFSGVLRTMFYSFFFSVLGGLAGSFARWKGFSGRDQRRGEAFFVIFADNLYTIAAFSLVFLVFFLWEGRAHFEALEREMLILYATALFFGCVVSAVFFYSKRPHRWLAGWVKKWSPRSERGFWIQLKVLDALRVWQIAKGAGQGPIPIFLIFLAYALLGVVTTKVLAIAVGIQISWFCAGWLCALPRIIQVVPLTVAGIGINEGVLMFSLSKYGVELERALLMGMLISCSGILYSIAGGMIFLFNWYRQDI